MKATADQTLQLDKLEVARRQLGAALQLFLDNCDPVSVHVLVCGGMELAQGLAEAAGAEAFEGIAIDANSDLTPELYRKARNSTWNAFKHFSKQNGAPRDDSDLFAMFDDSVNEMALFIGWHDLALATGRVPIEAQVFQLWFFVRNPEGLHPNVRDRWQANYFPGINALPRSLHKAELLKAIRKACRNKYVQANPLTEKRALLLPNNLADLAR